MNEQEDNPQGHRHSDYVAAAFFAGLVMSIFVLLLQDACTDWSGKDLDGRIDKIETQVAE